MVPADKSPEQFAREISGALGRSPDEPGTKRLAAAMAGAPVLHDEAEEDKACRLTDDDRAGIREQAVRAMAYGTEIAWQALYVRVERVVRAAYFAGRHHENSYHRAMNDRRRLARAAAILEAKPFRDDGDATAGTLPLTSIGPSGIGGAYQNETKGGDANV